MSVLLVLKDPHSVLALHGCGSLGSLRSGLGTWGEGGVLGTLSTLPFFTSH